MLHACCGVEDGPVRLLHIPTKTPKIRLGVALSLGDEDEKNELKT